MVGDLYVWSYPSWKETTYQTLVALFPVENMETWDAGGMTVYHLSSVLCPQGEIGTTLNALFASAHGYVTANWVNNRWQRI